MVDGNRVAGEWGVLSDGKGDWSPLVKLLRPVCMLSWVKEASLSLLGTEEWELGIHVVTVRMQARDEDKSRMLKDPESTVISHWCHPIPRNSGLQESCSYRTKRYLVNPNTVCWMFYNCSQAHPNVTIFSLQNELWWSLAQEEINKNAIYPHLQAGHFLGS